MPSSPLTAAESSTLQTLRELLESKQPLSELDGLTVWHETRFQEEDIENVLNMATVDIVHLMLHTQVRLTSMER